MSLYWFSFSPDRAVPVRFPAFRRGARRFRWTGIYGVQIGPWFFGAVKGQVDPAGVGRATLAETGRRE